MGNTRTRITLVLVSVSACAGYAYWLKRRPLGRPTQSTESTDDTTAIVEPLTSAAIRRRIDDVFREGYLTLLAIIQGVALGVLLSSVYMHWQTSDGFWMKVRVVTQGVTVLGTVAVVTHRYILLTVLGRWIPSFFDTLIPYLLGVGEIGASIALGNDVGWWSAIAFFSMSGASSYVYSRRRTRASHYEANPMLYSAFRKASLLAMILLLVLFGISVLFVTLRAFGVGGLPLYALAPLCCLTVTTSIEIFGNYNFDVPGPRDTQSRPQSIKS